MNDLNSIAESSLCPVLGVPISVLAMSDAIAKVNGWVKRTQRAQLVTFVNAHMLVEAQFSSKFLLTLNQMDLNCPDGAPVHWLSRSLNRQRAEKISGPDFMPRFCKQSVELGHKHFIYGGAPGVAEEASKTLQKRYPGIQIAGYLSPPFHKLTADESADVAATINQSGADIVWVCLGCPKQEHWIWEMRDLLPGKVLLAVGQAVDIIAGRRERAPEFLVSHGAEWVYRLFKEPARLWKRYLVTNSLFLLFVLREKLTHTPEPTFSEARKRNL